MWGRTDITKCFRWTPTSRFPRSWRTARSTIRRARRWPTRTWPTRPRGFPKASAPTTRLNVDVNRRFSHGFQLRGVYTFSKSLDDGTALNSSVGGERSGFRDVSGRSQARLGPIHFGRAQSGRHQRRRTSFRSARGHGDWRRNWLGGGRSAPSRRCNRAFRSRRSWATTRPITATAATRCGHRGIRLSAARVIDGGPNQYFNPNAFMPPATRHVWQCGARRVDGPGPGQTGFFGAQEYGHLGEAYGRNSARSFSIF